VEVVALTSEWIVVAVVMPSAMGIPAQGMSAVPMLRAQQYKMNYALRNPQQPVAGQPMPAPVRFSFFLCLSLSLVITMLLFEYHVPGGKISCSVFARLHLLK